jgi:phosphatidate cytidylyltransferase
MGSLCVIFVIFVTGLRAGSIKYQINNFGASIFHAVVISQATEGIVSCYYFGAAWGMFVLFSVILNDIFAYFAGKSMGRTKLISLSPNKTLEGFIGGAIANCIFTFLVCNWAFSIESFICMIDKVHLQPFHPIVCGETTSAAYKTYEQPLTFPILGHTSVTTSKAAITALFFCLYASLVSPFAGFLASGVKRAFKIKDFGNMIPGHGGFLDRFDCILMMGCFSGVLLRNVMFQDQLDLQQAEYLYSGLTSTQKDAILQWLAPAYK